MRRTAVTLLVVATLVISSTTALAAVHGPTNDSSPMTRDGAQLQSVTQQHSSNNSSVTVGVGRQLSTVMVEVDSNVRTDFEEFSFDDSFEDADTSSRARLVAERADAVVEQAAALRRDYRVATVAYEQGDISRTTYAQYLATLNVRAENIESSIDRVQAKATSVSALDLRAAGYSVSEIRRAERAIDELTGAGVSELRQRFTGHGTGDVNVDREDGGLTVRVSSQNGDVTREIERERDAEDSISVDQTAALETARNALDAPGTGTWSLEHSSIHRGDGGYEFTFVLTGTNATGTAEVSVDGSTGAVYSLEAEVDAPGGDDSDDDSDTERGDSDGDSDSEISDSDDEDDEGEFTERGGALTVLATGGISESGSQTTVRVMDGGAPVRGAVVTVNGQAVGTTDADGTITVSVPDDDTVIRAQSGSATGALSVDAEENEDEELYENIDADARSSNGKVTVTLSYDGSGIGGATVYANGQAVGTTDSGGTLTFDATENADLDVRVQKGEFEASFSFASMNGAYSLSDTTIGDDDSDDGDAEEDDGEDVDTDGETDDNDSDADEDSETDDNDSESSDGDDTDSDETTGTDTGDTDGDSNETDTEGTDDDTVDDQFSNDPDTSETDADSDSDADGDDETDKN